MLPAELDDDVPDPDEVPLADDRLDATLDDTLDASEVTLLSTLLTMLLAMPLALLWTRLRGVGRASGLEVTWVLSLDSRLVMGLVCFGQVE